MRSLLYQDYPRDKSQHVANKYAGYRILPRPELPYRVLQLFQWKLLLLPRFAICGQLEHLEEYFRAGSAQK